MKRRLDLALALLHRPRLLFLDEPTTGLDPQSRAALWDEVRRLAQEGVTVFLTTQYLEEADVLADRVGIIDHGKIVAEGTPTELKAEIGRQTVEAVPQDPGDRERLAGVLHRFGEDGRLRRRRGRAAARRAPATWPRSCARSTPRGSKVADLRLHAPTLDDVFLAKTGRSLEGAADTARSPGQRRHARRARHRVSAALSTQIWALAERSMLKTLRQPFQMFPVMFFPAMLLAVNASGLQARPPACPASHALLHLLRDRRGLHPGRHVLADQHRHQPRRGHRERLLQPACADADAPARR